MCGTQRHGRGGQGSRLPSCLSLQVSSSHAAGAVWRLHPCALSWVQPLSRRVGVALSPSFDMLQSGALSTLAEGQRQQGGRGTLPRHHHQPSALHGHGTCRRFQGAGSQCGRIAHTHACNSHPHACTHWQQVHAGAAAAPSLLWLTLTFGGGARRVDSVSGGRLQKRTPCAGRRRDPHVHLAAGLCASIRIQRC